MAGTLLSEQKTDRIGEGVAAAADATVFVRGTFDGAKVYVEISDEDVSASYMVPHGKAIVAGPRPIAIEAKGSYFIRARLVGAGEQTNVTANFTGG